MGSLHLAMFLLLLCFIVGMVITYYVGHQAGCHETLDEIVEATLKVRIKENTKK